MVDRVNSANAIQAAKAERKKRHAQHKSDADLLAGNFLKAVTAADPAALAESDDFNDLQKAAAMQMGAHNANGKNAFLGRIMAAGRSSDAEVLKREGQPFVAVSNAPDKNPEVPEYLRISIAEKIELLAQEQPEDLVRTVQQLVGAQQLAQALHVLMTTQVREIHYRANKILEARYAAESGTSTGEHSGEA